MIFIVPFKTPTINHLYGQHGVRKYLKPEAKELREKIKEIIDNSGIDPVREPPVKLEVHVRIFEDWLCKNGSVKRKDVSNREKFLIDSVFDALGIDDKMIFKHTMEKVQSNEEEAWIEISEYEE